MVASKIDKTKLFQPGVDNGGGRRKGSRNKITIDIREKFYHTYNDMGKLDKVSGDQAFLNWARINKKTFYSLFAKLAPTNLNIHDGREHESFIDRMALQMLEANAVVIDDPMLPPVNPDVLQSNDHVDTLTIDRDDESQVVSSKGVNLDLVVSPSIV